jgi:hypothetical protein
MCTIWNPISIEESINGTQTKRYGTFLRQSGEMRIFYHRYDGRIDEENETITSAISDNPNDEEAIVAVDEANEISSDSSNATDSTESDLGQNESIQAIRDSDESSVPSFTGIPTSTPIASPQTGPREIFQEGIRRAPRQGQHKAMRMNELDNEVRRIGGSC